MNAEISSILIFSWFAGHSQSGYLKETDFINRMLIGIINMAAYPEPLSSSLAEFTPVDYVTKAIIYLRQVLPSMHDCHRFPNLG